MRSKRTLVPVSSPSSSIPYNAVFSSRFRFAATVLFPLFPFTSNIGALASSAVAGTLATRNIVPLSNPKFLTPVAFLLPKLTLSARPISTKLHMGAPKRGGAVENYQTISVNCAKCRTKLFRYKKKNGTKSNLIKCYVERISEDCVGLLASRKTADSKQNQQQQDWICPECNTRFGRDSMIHGRPAIKFVGGKIQMTKK